MQGVECLEEKNGQVKENKKKSDPMQGETQRKRHRNENDTENTIIKSTYRKQGGRETFADWRDIFVPVPESMLVLKLYFVDPVKCQQPIGTPWSGDEEYV